MKILKKGGLSKLKALTIRIPGGLASDISEVRQRARAGGFEFPLNDVCSEALRAALARAQSDLASMPPLVDVRQQNLPIADSPESSESAIGASNFAHGGSN
jgi:hypothetical protein